MPDQTIKHDNAIPGFLLILIPLAFFAVFLSIAWPFILGGTLLLTGNSVWQSYQWTKLSQQVNPVFSRLIIEKQGSITPLDLSARANISGAVAQRYLNGKAMEVGGVSYQETSGGQVYSFLTVGTLTSALAEIPTESSFSQKLEELSISEPAPAAKLAPVQPKSAPVKPAVIEVAVIPEPVVPEAELRLEEPAAPIPELTVDPVVESAPPLAEPLETAREIPVTITEPAAAIETPIVETPQPEIAPPVSPAPSAPVVKTIEKVAVVEPVPVADNSNFTKALRDIFNNPPASTPEPEVVAEVVNEAAAPTLEIISQADLAKRLDVHASTIYKRRSDISFEDWTRNRDPEGIAWGYNKETKEFYRVG
jgi:hypothetical protein